MTEDEYIDSLTRQAEETSKRLKGGEHALAEALLEAMNRMETRFAQMEGELWEVRHRLSTLEDPGH